MTNLYDWARDFGQRALSGAYGTPVPPFQQIFYAAQFFTNITQINPDIPAPQKAERKNGVFVLSFDSPALSVAILVPTTGQAMVETSEGQDGAAIRGSWRVDVGGPFPEDLKAMLRRWKVTP